MTAQDDTWLDNLLANPPHVAERNFTDLTLARISHYQRRRRTILMSAWLLALLIVVLTLPWDTLGEWIQVWTSNDMLTNLLSKNSVNDSSLQWANVLRDNWLMALAIISTLGVALKNSLLQET